MLSSRVPEPWSGWLIWSITIATVLFLLHKSVRGIIRWATTRYLFTSHRILTTTGLFVVSGESIALNKIQTIQFKKTLLERLLGSGSLVIESAAENEIIISNVTGAEDVHRSVYEQISALEDDRPHLLPAPTDRRRRTQKRQDI